MTNFNGAPSLEETNETGVENSPEFKKLLEIAERLKGMVKENEGNPKVRELLNLAEKAGLME